MESAFAEHGGLGLGGGSLVVGEGVGYGVGLRGVDSREGADAGELMFNGKWLQTPSASAAREEEEGVGGRHAVRGNGVDGLSEGSDSAPNGEAWCEGVRGTAN